MTASLSIIAQTQMILKTPNTVPTLIKKIKKKQKAQGPRKIV